MSNISCEEYWRALEISKAPNEMTKMGEAMKLLLKAYRDEKAVYVACRFSNASKTEAQQLYVDYNGKRVYLCYTSPKKFVESKITDAECEMINTKTMINNVLSKKDVFGFVFNYRCSDMTITPYSH